LALIAMVPNFSEGRRADVMDAIVDALVVDGVRLLYRQADPDHNRLDTTLAGAADAVRRSALAGAAEAARSIDMTLHRGSHPRMGALDVLPFVPVHGVGMADCVALARDVAREIGDGLGIPTYCYGEAALSPERSSLAEVRKGEFEGLRDDVAAGRRLPDFGPQSIGSAGATAVGARKPLVAFNVYLEGTEEAAKAVARTLREASGGLPTVRAIGFSIPDRGCVTVSMNLTDFEVVAPAAALEAVREAGASHGMRVLDTEIVGLVPAAALPDEPGDTLLLRGFDPATQVFETAVGDDVREENA